MNAIEFCKKLDNELGETWSNDYQELPEKMEEYAKIYHEQQLKILNIPDVNNLAKFCKEISQQKNCPSEFVDIVNKEFWNLI